MGMECALLMFKAWFYLSKYPRCRLPRLQSKWASWSRGVFNSEVIFRNAFNGVPHNSFHFHDPLAFQLIYLPTYCVESVSLILKLVQNDRHIYERQKGQESFYL